MEDHDIPELAHKIIASAKIARYSETEQELSFEFTDGTSFSFSACSRVISELSVYRGGVGEPQVIRTLKFD
ncbi:MAG: hypothetical protein ABI072_07715 [Edaphobacter sp.]